MDTTDRIIIIGGDTYLLTFEPNEALVEIQPHQGKAEVFVDFPAHIADLSREYLMGQPMDDTTKPLWDALDAGDYVRILGHDEQWARITPLADLPHETIVERRHQLERAGALEELEGVERDLALAGLAWSESRGDERQAAAATYTAIRKAIAEGVSETAAAKLAGVDRMTVRRALGKR